MDANQLVHIAGYGHFRIQKITSAREPFSDPSAQVLYLANNNSVDSDSVIMPYKVTITGSVSTDYSYTRYI